MNSNEWFYIKHVQSDKVVSVSNEQDALRSQAIVTTPKHTDSELWCWDDQRLKNKRTGLVLDIRKGNSSSFSNIYLLTIFKGKLRLIEDTEICLYHKKPESAQNQLWATKLVETAPFEQHPLSKKEHHGSAVMIYSACNSDWVLDVSMDGQKLVLFPLHHDGDEAQKQKWSIIYENDMQNSSHNSTNEVLESNTSVLGDDYVYYHNGSISSVSTDSNNSSTMDFAYGLTPSKRSSATSIHVSSRSGSIVDENHIIQILKH